MTRTAHFEDLPPERRKKDVAKGKPKPYIMLRHDIFDNRRIAMVRRAIGVPRKTDAVGFVSRWWTNVARCQATEYGEITSLSADDIEEWAEWDGQRGIFYAALVESGLIETDADGRVWVRDWWQHRGLYLETRDTNRRRQAAYRNKRKQKVTRDVTSDISGRGKKVSHVTTSKVTRDVTGDNPPKSRVTSGVVARDSFSALSSRCDDGAFLPQGERSDAAAQASTGSVAIITVEANPDAHLGSEGTGSNPARAPRYPTRSVSRSAVVEDSGAARQGMSKREITEALYKVPGGQYLAGKNMLALDSILAEYAVTHQHLADARGLADQWAAEKNRHMPKAMRGDANVTVVLQKLATLLAQERADVEACDASGPQGARMVGGGRVLYTPQEQARQRAFEYAANIGTRGLDDLTRELIEDEDRLAAEAAAQQKVAT